MYVKQFFENGYQLNETIDNEIIIKYSADSTNIANQKKVINFTFSLVNLNKTDSDKKISPNSASGSFILGKYIKNLYKYRKPARKVPVHPGFFLSNYADPIF